MGESIRLTDYMLECTEQENEDGLIMFTTNVEKAFDSVEHEFIFATLRRFNFGSQFVHWIKIMLN